MRYVVYTEIIEDTIERWYYGTYDNSREANNVAIELGCGNGVYHCVCTLDEAREMEVKNLPF